MPGHIFPRIPYDELRSEFIRDEIRAGSFADVAYRTYVNDLVYIEWYTTGGLSSNATGLSAAGADRTSCRIATKYPDAYDAVRREFDAETRAEYTVGWRGEEDPDERRRWARRHRTEWAAVRDGTSKPECMEITETPITDRPSFAPFRFPQLPYDELQSEFIVGEIQRGSFDDLEYRQYVNELVYVETWTRKPRRVASGAYPPVRPWIVAATHPCEYDWIRADLGASTRADLEPIPEVAYGNSNIDTRAKRHKQEWQRVQETAD